MTTVAVVVILLFVGLMFLMTIQWRRHRHSQAGGARQRRAAVRAQLAELESWEDERRAWDRERRGVRAAP
jgi:hypothetical protein